VYFTFTTDLTSYRILNISWYLINLMYDLMYVCIIFSKIGYIVSVSRWLTACSTSNMRVTFTEISLHVMFLSAKATWSKLAISAWPVATRLMKLS